MILERLSGRTLDEELAARRAGVQDVHFLREVLYQVRGSTNHQHNSLPASWRCQLAVLEGAHWHRSTAPFRQLILQLSRGSRL